MHSLTPDRTTPPVAQPFNKVPFPAVRQSTLNNGIPVYALQFGTEEIMEVFVVFYAGKSFETVSGTASFTAKMLREGSTNYSALEFAQKLDEYGAFMQTSSGNESAQVGLTTLTKHFESVLPLVREMVLEPVFPEAEFDKLKRRTLQNLEVEAEKTNYIARKSFNELLFGEAHPYGRVQHKAEVEKVAREDMLDFYRSQYGLNNCFLVIAGRFNEEHVQHLLNESLGKEDITPFARTSKTSVAASAAEVGFHYLEKKDSQQATIRVGHRGFARNHPDYYKMQVVSTILGGYFGSRLMQNIREEKGYTYGISAGWLSMKYDGMFIIQTDVGNAYIEPTLAEIRKELDLLLKNGVEQAELDLVKNYLLGRSISSRETPDQVGEIVQALLINEVPFSQLDDKFEIIQSLTVTDISELANRYFRPENLLEVVCGKME